MVTVFVVLFLFTTMKCGISYAEKSVQLHSIIPDVMDLPENNQVASIDIPIPIPLADIDPMFDNELERISGILLSVLKYSWGPNGVPIVYLEDNTAPDNPGADGDELAPAEARISGPALKRSRYYRRYPWKRQNSRSRTRYEVDNRYMCQPSREDVFKLLVALHETRAGNGGKSINFCNRRRSAGAIFTNIRFLGKK